MLRADELASISTTIDGFLPEAVTVRRAGLLLSPQPTMPDGSALRCRVRPDTKETRMAGAPREEEARRWVITLPLGCPVLAGDRLTALGCVYSVVEVVTPLSYAVQTTVYAYLLYDATGAYAGVRANAVVSTTRAGLPLLTLVPVRLTYPDPPRQAETAFGPIVREALILADPAQDWLMGDLVTVASIGTGFARSPETSIFRVVQATQQGDGPPAWIVALDGRQGMGA